ncbi:hypothetical protein Hamer_G020503 [Homarus americanus]|uniref:Uncharacterized protein n=1 Tax=Homarus americanus TaxID=6706 RepID=A0A8J5N6R1_HOMAM|nr:hypothetical protein Hamer_G020503 [Homarus americanus]
MTQQFLTSVPSSGVMRLAETPVPEVSQADGHFEVLRRPFDGPNSKDFTSDVQKLNLHPDRKKAKPGPRRRGADQGGGTVSPQSIDELYWMLPGAVLSDSESCFSSMSGAM